MEYEHFELQTDSSFRVSCSYRVPFNHRQSGGPRFRHTKAMHCDGQSEDGLSRLRTKTNGSGWTMAANSRKPGSAYDISIACPA